MNWGKSIVLAFVVFAGFVGFMAYKMATAKVDLVRSNYYQSELDYEKQIARVKNAKPFQDSIINYSIAQESIKVEFPKTITKGEVNFYRSSDNALDFNVPVSNSQIVEQNTSKMKKGNWKVQAIWSDGSQEYFVENEYNIQ